MKSKAKINSRRRSSLLKNIFNKRLSTLIFFVTSVCNSRCVSCFNWQNLNQKDDLTLEEIEKTSKNMPRLNHILFSGGEPTLRKDLPEICEIFQRNNEIKSISIPTNGLQPEVIKELICNIILKNPDLEIGIHFSMDGLQETHDTLRGVEGSFEKVQESIKNVLELGKEHSQIDTSINTVISNKNYKELPDLIEFVKTLNVDSHTFDFLRGSIKDEQLIHLPSLEEMKQITKLRTSTRTYYLKDKGFLSRMFSIMKEHYVIKTQLDVLQGKKLPFQCYGGSVCVVLSHNGNVGLCELLDPVGNLRDNDYNFMNIWNSQKANRQRNVILNHECDCSHICFLSMSIDHSPRTIFFNMPLSYLLKK